MKAFALIVASAYLVASDAYLARAPPPPRARARGRPGSSRVALSGWFDGLSEGAKGVGEGLKNFGAFQEKMGKQLRAEQAERAEKAGGGGAPKTLFGLSLSDGEPDTLSEYQRAEQSFWVKKAREREMKPKIEGLCDTLGCSPERAEALLLSCDGDVAKATVLFESESAGEPDQDQSAPESTE